jgi:hypothetical protein
VLQAYWGFCSWKWKCMVYLLKCFNPVTSCPYSGVNDHYKMSSKPKWTFYFKTHIHSLNQIKLKNRIGFYPTVCTAVRTNHGHTTNHATWNTCAMAKQHKVQQSFVLDTVKFLFHSLTQRHKIPWQGFHKWLCL